MAEQLPDISVIIATRNRAESLRTTLASLQAADRRGLRVDVVVVDNAGTDDTRSVVESFSPRLPVRYLYEPVLGVFGKSHAVNRALDTGGLGEIIAILDDDISADPKWFQAVAAISRRWPGIDIFTGLTYIIYPAENVPEWARRPHCQGLVCSAGGFGNTDRELDPGQFCVGGHFWFRSRVLQHVPHFSDCWLTEPHFQLDLAEFGCRTVASPEAIVGHRVQAALLDRKTALIRVYDSGKQIADMRLRPYRSRVKQARMLNQHPWLGRAFCLLSHLRWRLSWAASFFHSSDAIRFERRLIATERMSTYLELFRAAGRYPEYSPWKSARQRTPHPVVIPGAQAANRGEGLSRL